MMSQPSMLAGQSDQKNNFKLLYSTQMVVKRYNTRHNLCYLQFRYAVFLEHCKTTHAMGRVGTVDEVASAITFLASNAASFITGQTLAIDGGRSIMCPR